MKLLQQFSLIIIAVFLHSKSSAQFLQWAKHMSSVNVSQALSMTTDIYGNSYTTGNFSGTSDFDPGPGIHNVISYGMQDVFIQKLDPNGNLIWVKQIGNNMVEGGRVIALDNNNNIYVSGTFDGILDVDPGAGTFFISSSSPDIFLLKLDSLGNFIWCHTLGGSNGADEGFAILIDSANNVHLSGNFGLIADFDPGPGAFNMNGAIGNSFIWKLDSAGQFVWAIQFGGPPGCSCYDLEFDLYGNILAVGTFTGTGDFDPGPGIYSLTAGYTDAYVGKFTATGQLVWMKQIGGTDLNAAHDIAIDSLNNVYVCGEFWQTSDFDPGPSIFNLTSNGWGDIFVVKLNSTGAFVWAKSYGSLLYDESRKIVCTDDGKLYLGGHVGGATDFDPGPGNFTLPAAGGREIFLQRLDTAGNFEWATSCYNNGEDRCYDFTIDSEKNIYMTGCFTLSVDFDPNAGTFFMTTPGANQNIFVCKYGLCSIDTVNHYYYACDSITLNQSSYFTSGTYLQTIQSSAGCDSIVKLFVSIGNLDTSVIINGNTLTSNATDVFYQWIDCESQNPIAGETDSLFTPLSMGNYGVIVSQNSCSDTSACFSITPEGIINGYETNELIVYPNPSNGRLIIKFSDIQRFVEIDVTHISGQIVVQEKNNFIQERMLILNCVPGVYIVGIKTSEISKQIPLIIK